MYILLAVIGAIAIGAVVHALVPSRSTRGVLVSGAIAGATAAIVYTAMTWSGIAESNVWLWVASLGGALVISLAGTAAITRARVTRDAAEDARLGIA